nr:hypothetical protein [Tanacetum cinerariifolium]
MQIAQLGMNMGQDRQMQIVRCNGGNQFRQYVGQKTRNPAGYNDVIENQEIWLRVQQIMKGSDIGIQEKKAKLFNEWERQMQMVGGNGGNQFRQYDGQNAGNPAGYNDVIGNQVNQNAVQNPRVQNVGNQNEYDLMAAAADLDEIEEVNANCILMANLQQTSTSDESAEVHENCNDNEIFNMFTQEDQYTELLEPIPESHQVPQNDNDVIYANTSVEEGGEIVEQHPVNFEETRALYESLYHNLEIEVEKVNSKLENENVKLKFQVLNYARENAHLKATYKKLFDSISVSRAQTKTIIASLQNELQSNIYKNAKLRTQLFKKVSDQKDNTKNTSENTEFAKQPIVENLPKIGETNALSKPVTSNSVSTPQESKGVNNDKVIAPGMFRITPDKTSREAKKVPNTVSVSARTKPITVSQPHVITKKDVNSDLNGLSSTGVDNTKTRRPQPRSNTKNDRVPSASKSS